MTASRRRVGEFELIARHFAPLARNFAGAGGLESDNAFLASDRRHDTAVKTDTVVAGVHFLDDETPERVAAKALRMRAGGRGVASVSKTSRASSSGWARGGWRRIGSARVIPPSGASPIIAALGSLTASPSPLRTPVED